MKKKALHSGLPGQLHVAIIMDGNGRWATDRGLPRTVGHLQGMRVTQQIVDASPLMGISALTLFAFSAYNWDRPQEEVAGLMEIFETFLRANCINWAEQGTRLNLIGRRDRLPSSLLKAAAETEAATAHCQTFQLRLAIDYSSRESILRAASIFQSSDKKTTAAFSKVLHSHEANLGTFEVDLLLRTGGEKRLSDFLLWECAHAELIFMKRKWPDFQVADLVTALHEFRSRQRRFGRISGRVTSPTT